MRERSAVKRLSQLVAQGLILAKDVKGLKYRSFALKSVKSRIEVIYCPRNLSVKYQDRRLKKSISELEELLKL